MTQEDFALDIINANKKGKAVVFVIESSDGEVEVWTNSDRANFVGMASMLLQTKWTGRVPASEVWGEWQHFYDSPDEAEVYGYELEDGVIQVGILDISIAEAQKRLS